MSEIKLTTWTLTTGMNIDYWYGHAAVIGWGDKGNAN